MTTEQVNAQSELLVHMIIRLEDGSIADNTRRSARPTRLILGDKSLSPAFEQALLDMKLGVKKEFQLTAEDAFGPVLEANVMSFPRNKFAQDIEIELGMIIECENKQGGALLGIIRSIDDDNVLLDFNHPLAGRTVHFEIEILEIH